MKRAIQQMVYDGCDEVMCVCCVWCIEAEGLI